MATRVAITNVDLQVSLDSLRGVAHTSRMVAKSGYLQSRAKTRQKVVTAVGLMDNEIARLQSLRTFIDEGHAGPVLATIHQPKADKEGLIVHNRNLSKATTTLLSRGGARGQDRSPCGRGEDDQC